MSVRRRGIACEWPGGIIRTNGVCESACEGTQKLWWRCQGGKKALLSNEQSLCAEYFSFSGRSMPTFSGPGLVNFPLPSVIVYLARER